MLGFTLVEFVITLVVLALLTFASLPSISTWLAGARVRNAAESFLAGLQKARMEAIRRNQAVGFWIVGGGDERSVGNDCALVSDSGSWVISRQDPSGRCAAAASDSVAPMIVETHAAGDGGAGATVAALVPDGSAAASRVVFDGFGRVQSPDDSLAQIDFSNPNGARALRIQLSPGGGIRLCDPAVAAPDTRACS